MNWGQIIRMFAALLRAWKRSRAGLILAQRREARATAKMVAAVANSQAAGTADLPVLPFDELDQLSRIDQPWLLLLHKGATLLPGAKERLAELTMQVEADLIYADSIVLDEKTGFERLHLKPAWDPVRLAEQPYIGGLMAIRRDVLSAFLETLQKPQVTSHADFLAKLAQWLPAHRAAHLPHPLVKESLAAPIPLAANLDAEPRIRIIIPNRNSPELMAQVLEGLYKKTDYLNFEVWVVDNGSTDQKTLNLYDNYAGREGFRALIETRPFNFSDMINTGLAKFDADAALLLNNDVEVIHADWLQEMAWVMGNWKAGIVGARLLFPDDTVQHAGVIVGHRAKAGHAFYRQPRQWMDPFQRLACRQSVSCVTGAAMLISKRCIETVGAWDENNFAVAYNDVDYCIRARRRGFGVAWTPNATLYHHESVSRGRDISPERRRQFEQEKQALMTLHGTAEFQDPWWHPHLSRTASLPSPQFNGIIADARFWTAG
ncbi:MAG: glycosyltransferase [Pseudomonadota bacterium]